MVKDFPKYEVSNLGRVRSPRGILKPHVIYRGKGYHMVALYRGSVKREIYVHHLVLEAFVGDRPNGMVGAHLNSKSTDNRLENLVWATRRENASHRVANGTLEASLTDEQIEDIRSRYAKGNISQQKLANEYGVSQRHISTIVRKR